MTELDELSKLKSLAIRVKDYCDEVERADISVKDAIAWQMAFADLVRPMVKDLAIGRFAIELEKLRKLDAASDQTTIKGRIENWIFDGLSVVGTLYGTKLGLADAIQVSPQISGPIDENGIAQTRSGLYELGRPAWYGDETTRIIWGLVRNIGSVFNQPRPLWSAIVEAVGIGSTSAKELCHKYDMDPEMSVGAWPDDDRDQDEIDEDKRDDAIDRLEYDEESGEERAGDQGAIDNTPAADKQKEPAADDPIAAALASFRRATRDAKSLADFDPKGRPKDRARPTYAQGVRAGIVHAVTVCDFIATPIEDDIQEHGIHGPHFDGPATVRKVEHNLRQLLK